MKVVILPVGLLETNCYIVYDENSMDGVIIDPGADADIIQKRVKNLGINPRAVLNTHGHQDHTGANDATRDAFGIPLYVHQADEELFTDAKQLLMGFGSRPAPQRPADHYVKGGEVLKIGALEFEVMHTPGHTKGGVVFYMPAHKIAFCGDTLFKGTIGRTDLFGGDYATLLHSLQKVMQALPDDTVVYPGHGPKSDMGFERRYNPYFRA